MEGMGSWSEMELAVVLPWRSSRAFAVVLLLAPRRPAQPASQTRHLLRFQVQLTGDVICLGVSKQLFPLVLMGCEKRYPEV
jgi:hypothetical protein